MEYFNLNQLITNDKTDLKIRQLKNRIKLVSTKVTDTNLLTKVGRKWQIHKSILYLFQSTWLKKQGLRTEISINLQDDYDNAYYTAIANDIAKLDISKTLLYSIENFTTKHIHIATALTVKQTKRILATLDKQRDYVILTNPNTNVAPIGNLKDYIDYISKEVTPMQLNG